MRYALYKEGEPNGSSYTIVDCERRVIYVGGWQVGDQQLRRCEVEFPIRTYKDLRQAVTDIVRYYGYAIVDSYETGNRVLCNGYYADLKENQKEIFRYMR